MSTSSRDEGRYLYREGRYAAALELYISEETDPAEDLELAYLMGLCHARLGEEQEAMRLLGQVVAHDTHLARIYQARMLLAWLLAEDGEVEQAEHCLREVLQEGFESPQAWAALGYCQSLRGDNGAAVESYQHAVDLDQDNANAVNGLGYLMAESGLDLDAAVGFCRKAQDSDPKNAAYLDSLGWALFLAGRPSEAVRHLTAALSLKPDNPIIKEHLEAVRTHVQD
ncbi:MAG: tetratricopeptide repeat protein [Spirochaetales bacterium]|nr:tetratricopeptide repeat protein [Spirochaetales bacterium]